MSASETSLSGAIGLHSAGYVGWHQRVLRAGALGGDLSEQRSGVERLADAGRGSEVEAGTGRGVIARLGERTQQPVEDVPEQPGAHPDAEQPSAAFDDDARPQPRRVLVDLSHDAFPLDADDFAEEPIRPDEDRLAQHERTVDARVQDRTADRDDACRRSFHAVRLFQRLQQPSLDRGAIGEQAVERGIEHVVSAGDDESGGERRVLFEGHADAARLQGFDGLASFVVAPRRVMTDAPFGIVREARGAACQMRLHPRASPRRVGPPQGQPLAQTFPRQPQLPDGALLRH